MPDVEEVIKGLECIRDWAQFTVNHGWIVVGASEKMVKYAEDALALLKAQEPVEPKIVDTSNSKLYHNDMFKNHYCGNCGEFLHVVNRKDMFCSQCGRAVKWE